MFEAFTKVNVVSDKTKELLKGLNDLAKMDVLVGIPEEKSSRPGGIGDKINNAELAYIHTHGIRRRSMIAEMDVEMDQGTPYSKAYEMYLQEHGSPLWSSPPRPIIEPAIEDPENKETIARQLSEAASEALDGNIAEAKKELEKAGMLGQNAVRDWFTNPKNGWPPNSPSTIERKGSDKPLIDTGELQKSISYVVREK